MDVVAMEVDMEGLHRGVAIEGAIGVGEDRGVDIHLTEQDMIS